MTELNILNGKEIRQILGLIERQWGAKLNLDFGFLRNNKNRIFVINKDVSRIDPSSLRINSVGMYFCELDKTGIRLSMEGCQIVGPGAAKNMVVINYEDTKKWFKGEDLGMPCSECSGFIILKHEKDFLGNGKYSNGKILNYVGKSRRVNLI